MHLEDKNVERKKTDVNEHLQLLKTDVHMYTYFAMSLSLTKWEVVI